VAGITTVRLGASARLALRCSNLEEEVSVNLLFHPTYLVSLATEVSVPSGKFQDLNLSNDSMGVYRPWLRQAHKNLVFALNGKEVTDISS
jgi:hypothetical protein